jgi:hypothetical protein
MSKATNKFTPEAQGRAIRMVWITRGIIRYAGQPWFGCRQDRLRAADASRVGERWRTRH